MANKISPDFKDFRVLIPDFISGPCDGQIESHIHLSVV